MKKKIIVVAGIGFFLLVVLLVAASGNKNVKDSFNKGMEQGRTVAQGSNVTSAQEVNQKIEEALKDKNIQVESVNFVDSTGFANIWIKTEPVFSSSETLRDAWRTLYVTYNLVPEMKRIGVAVKQDNNKIFEVTVDRTEIDAVLKPYTSETEKNGVEAGTVRYVAPIFRQLQVSGHPDLMAIIKK